MLMFKRALKTASVHKQAEFNDAFSNDKYAYNLVRVFDAGDPKRDPSHRPRWEFHR